MPGQILIGVPAFWHLSKSKRYRRNLLAHFSALHEFLEENNLYIQKVQSPGDPDWTLRDDQLTKMGERLILDIEETYFGGAFHREVPDHRKLGRALSRLRRLEDPPGATS